MAKGVRRAPKINKEELKLKFGWFSDSIERNLKKIKNLVALRDEVLRLHKNTEEAMREDWEVTIGGNSVNCFEASLTLEPLKKLADKCK